MTVVQDEEIPHSSAKSCSTVEVSDDMSMALEGTSDSLRKKKASRKKKGASEALVSPASDVAEPALIDNSKHYTEEKGWNPRHFIGEFTDSLSHQVYVVEVSAQNGRIVYHAHFVRRNCPDKRFVLTKQRLPNGFRRWMCGNGLFVRPESSFDKIVWKTEDGRTNIWTRNAPKGPVYFDPPPALQLDIDSMMKQFTEERAKMKEHRAAEMAAQGDGTSKTFTWNVAASEFVPPTGLKSAAGHLAEKSTLPRVQGPETKTMRITEEGSLRWTLDEKWAELKDMPRDFSVASPQFDVGDVKNLQLTFFPTGRSAAEFSGCSLQLMTGTLPSGTGIKFQVKINGFGQGNKVCLKKRYVGDFPRLDEKTTKEVVIEVHFLALFQESNYKVNM